LYRQEFIFHPRFLLAYETKVSNLIWRKTSEARVTKLSDRAKRWQGMTLKIVKEETCTRTRPSEFFAYSIGENRIQSLQDVVCVLFFVFSFTLFLCVVFVVVFVVLYLYNVMLS